MGQLLRGQVAVSAMWTLEPVVFLRPAGSKLPQEGQVKGSLRKWHL